MASITLCKINSGNGIKKINPQYISSRNLLILTAAPPSTVSSLRSKVQSHQRRGLVIKSRAAEYANEAVKGENVCTSDDLKLKHNLNGALTAKEEEEELSRSTLLWRAAKLPLHTPLSTPVIVACAAAYWQTGIFYWDRFFLMLASYQLVNCWADFSNDVYDFDTGADKDKKESLVNLFGRRNTFKIIAWSLLAIAFAGFSVIALAAKNTRSLVFLVHAVFCVLIYQCPPFRLSYYGVGEPFLCLGYGPLSTLGFYLLNSGRSELPITSTVTWASLPVGFTIALINFCSHFHQIEGDKAVGKMSPMVRLGTEKASHVVKWSVIGLYFLLFALGYTKTIPFACAVFGAMTIPIGNFFVDFVQKYHKNKSKIFTGRYICGGFSAIFGTALAAGFVVSRLFAGQVPRAI